MDTYFTEILSTQERKFKNRIMRDFLSFNAQYKENSGFPFLEITSKEFELQKFFEVRLEHYIRELLVNDVLSLSLKNKGAEIYKSKLSDKEQISELFFTNEDYEKKVGYEFVADFGSVTVMYRYTDIDIKAASNLLSDFEDKLVILNWTNPAANEEKKSVALPNGQELQYCSLYELFQERIGVEEYQEFIVFLTGTVIEFQEFIGVKTTPKLSPFSLGKFRFEVENNIKQYIQQIRDYMKADERISTLGFAEFDGINYGYQVIDNENKKKYGIAEKSTKTLLRESDILRSFEGKRLYRYLIGGADFAKSFITSEYLYKQYDCDDCFDYTAIVSGYLKSIEQLLYHISNFSKGKGYKIKNNGQKNKNGVYPPSIKVGKIYKIDFIEENDGCFDTTIGSLIHFLDDNKTDLLAIEDTYKETIIDCLNCYRIECRNDSFHLDNNYKWSRVEFIRRNTLLLYILLLSCCKLGDTEWHTQDSLQMILDDRLERLCNMIFSKNDVLYEFVFMGDGYLLDPITVKHVPAESSYPSYDSIGQIKSIFLTFESIVDQQKIVIMRRNVPEEIYYINDNGERFKIE